ncbi:hypothetical protein D9756_003821 [Leucocoprinus leucothites]|uniref:Serine/threonine-protein kinase RIO2 n=1 Tax=Leucocoprinus leucothites TaxID=201217 RepID=A0A8H5G012_9AGAR|nr:hypothetical protein D9756_003821 [Leucoagaricus leucothites]
MKLDATDLRYISSDEFRVLTAVEMGSKNHEVVPTPLIAQISGLRNGGVNKLIGSLAKRNLVSKVQNSKYDGYRLTYGGYDYLAMRALSKRDSMHSVGNQIGVGKESDIYIVADSEGNEMVLKLHRLGRISFRAIKEKRDYLGKRKSASWMYMSRLAAQKEWAFMKAYKLIRQVAELPSPGKLYSQLMDLIVRFAHAGLIHGDFNEFNILVRRETGEPVVIDFPQMVSTSHENAEWYFNRDVDCIRTFFRRRFQYESMLYPKFNRTVRGGQSGEEFRLDVMVEASGFGKKEMSTLEKFMDAVREDTKISNENENSDQEEEEDSEEEEDEEEGTEDEGVESDNAGTQDLKTDKSGKNQLGEGLSPFEGAMGSAHTDDGHHLETAIAPIDATRNPDFEDDSRLPSPDGLPQRLDALNLSDIRNKVTSDLSKTRSHQQRKYHSKRSIRQVGRPQGSKAKQDKNIRLDRGGIWD